MHYTQEKKLSFSEFSKFSWFVFAFITRTQKSLFFSARKGLTNLKKRKYWLILPLLIFGIMIFADNYWFFLFALSVFLLIASPAEIVYYFLFGAFIFFAVIFELSGNYAAVKYSGDVIFAVLASLLAQNFVFGALESGIISGPFAPSFQTDQNPIRLSVLRHSRSMAVIALCVWLLLFGLNNMEPYLRGIGSALPGENSGKTLDPSVPPSAALKHADQDDDGLSDTEESFYGTNPGKADTDGDGYGDKIEIENGFNPLGAGSLN